MGNKDIFNRTGLFISISDALCLRMFHHQAGSLGLYDQEIQRLNIRLL
jgi:hypothetical protein